MKAFYRPRTDSRPAMRCTALSSSEVGVTRTSQPIPVGNGRSHLTASRRTERYGYTPGSAGLDRCRHPVYARGTGQSHDLSLRAFVTDCAPKCPGVIRSLNRDDTTGRRNVGQVDELRLPGQGAVPGDRPDVPRCWHVQRHIEVTRGVAHGDAIRCSGNLDAAGTGSLVRDSAVDSEFL